MLTHFRNAVVLFVLLTLITGVAYPLVITVVAQGLFPDQANGSLLERDGTLIGSSLIGQSFDDPRYFWGRPSATAPVPYNAAASSGSNYGPTNPAQLDAVRGRVEMLKRSNPDQSAAVPVELVTASASGFDPHISPAATEFQVARVARARNLDAEVVRNVVRENTAGRVLDLVGEPRVNVLELNLALDRIQK